VDDRIGYTELLEDDGYLPIVSSARCGLDDRRGRWHNCHCLTYHGLGEAWPYRVMGLMVDIVAVPRRTHNGRKL
jgi:hypothetical protein